MKNTSFPSWAAPFVGLIVGALVGLRGAGRNNGIVWWQAVQMFAGAGLFAGFVIWMVELASRVEQSDGELVGLDVARASSEQWPLGLIGPLLAISSVILFCAAPVGLVLGIVALRSNSGSAGPWRKVSWVGIVLSLVAALSWAIHFMLP